MSDVLPDPGRKGTQSIEDLMRYAQMHGRPPTRVSGWTIWNG